MTGTAAPSRDARGVRLGRVLGVPVYVSASWLLLALVVTLTYGQVAQRNVPTLSTAGAYAVGFAFVVLLLLSVLLHELGHAVASQRLGIPVRAMTLWLLGGYTEMERESPSPRTEFLVALAGPVVSLVLGAGAVVAVLAFEPATVAHELAVQTALSNLSVGIFNLLPGLPLDGGRLLRAGVWRATADRHRGTAVAGWAGRVVAVLVVLAALALGAAAGTFVSLSLVLTVLVALFLWNGATQALRAGQVAARFGLLHAGSLARPAIPVPADLPLSEALRRAADLGARALVVVDGAGRPVGVATEAAVAATPVERRAWVPVQSVARTLEPGLLVPAGLSGEELVRAVQDTPATEYLVVDGARVVGVLSTADVVQRLEPGRASR